MREKVQGQCTMWPCQLSKSGMAGQKLKAEITVQNQLLEIRMAYCMARNFMDNLFRWIGSFESNLPIMYPPKLHNVMSSLLHNQLPCTIGLQLDTPV